jgi:hypothetical protein
VFPDPIDPAAFDQYVAAHPPASLDDPAIEQELEHWIGVIGKMLNTSAEVAASPQARRRRWRLSGGGVALAFLGIPLAFATWVLSLPVAALGAILAVYSEWKAHLERRQDKTQRDAGLRVIARLQALTTERASRRSGTP